jgi:hypothetical protein
MENNVCQYETSSQKFVYFIEVTSSMCVCIRGPFKKFVDWGQCAAVIQREAVTVVPSCSGGGNVVVARSSSL